MGGRERAVRVPAGDGAEFYPGSCLTWVLGLSPRRDVPAERLPKVAREGTARTSCSANTNPPYLVDYKRQTRTGTNSNERQKQADRTGYTVENTVDRYKNKASETCQAHRRHRPANSWTLNPTSGPWIPAAGPSIITT